MNDKTTKIDEATENRLFHLANEVSDICRKYEKEGLPHGYIFVSMEMVATL